MSSNPKLKSFKIVTNDGQEHVVKATNVLEDIERGQLTFKNGDDPCARFNAYQYYCEVQK